MKATIKTAIKTAIVVLAAVVACFAAACGSKVTSIAIEQSNMPQTTFVQGNDPDLSGGKLTVYSGTKSELVPLDDPAVSVSGYDKNKLGRQELTIGYEEQTTTLNVTTVARIVADEAVTKYFVGDEFAAAGGIRITRDDGTSFTADISDPEVSVSGFTSTAEGKTDVTVKYESASEKYSGSVSVTVYAIASKTLQRPSKISYDSHEKLDLSGGRIIYRNSDNSFTRQIPLTEDMVSGFDPSKATVDNRTAQTALKQSVAVSYNGFTGSYDVSIRFSDVSLVWLRADELSGLDWNSSATMPTAAQAEKAKEAVEAYFSLGVADKLFIDNDQLTAIVRPAAVYYLKMWNEELAKYVTFTVTESGVSLVDEDQTSYAKAKADLEKYNADKNVLYGYAQLLISVKTESVTKDIKVFENGDKTVAEYLAQVATPASVDEIVPAVLTYMTKLYECLMTVGDGWSDDISSVGTSVNKAYELFDSEYKKSEELYLATGKRTIVMLNSRMLTKYVSSWRAADDLFDIIFAYYNALDEDGDTAALDKMALVSGYFGLPDLLEDLYTNMFSAFLQRDLLYEGDTYDTTLFNMFYKRALDCLDEVADGEGLYADLCGKRIFAFGGDMPFSANEIVDILTYGDYGYIDNAAAAIGVPSVQALWDYYIGIIDTLYDNEMDYGELNKNPEFGEKIEQYLKMFVELTPTEQLIFLTSLNRKYRAEGGDNLEFDYLDGDELKAYTYFTLMIGLHYSEKLSASAHAAFNEYLLAVEIYARRNHFESGSLKSYNDRLASAKNLFSKLEDGEKNKLVECGGEIIAACDKIDQMHKTELPGATLNAEDELLVEKLKSALNDLNTVGFLMTNGTQNYNLKSAYYAAYETAYELALQITEGGSQGLKTVYRYGDDTFLSSDNAARYNFEYLVMFYFRANFFTYMRGHNGVYYQGKSNYLYNIYESSGIKALLMQAKPVMMVYVNYLRYGTVSDDINADEIAGILGGYFALPSEMQAALIGTDVGQSFYRGLVYYYTHLFGWDMTADAVGDGIILAFINATRYLAVCEVDESEDTLAQLKEAHEKLVLLYAGLESADKQLFDGAFGAHYQSYLDKYSQLTQE